MNSWLIHKLMHAPGETAVVMFIVIFILGLSTGLLVSYLTRYVYFRRKAQDIISKEERDILSELSSAEEIIKTYRIKEAQQEADTVTRRRKEEEAKLFFRRAKDAMGW